MIFSAGTDCNVQGNPEKPRVERGLSTEGLQFLKGMDERILRDVPSMLAGPGDGDKCPVEAVLVSFHQQPERLGLAAETSRDQRLIRDIIHDRIGFDEAIREKVPTIGSSCRCLSCCGNRQRFLCSSFHQINLQTKPDGEQGNTDPLSNRQRSS